MYKRQLLIESAKKRSFHNKKRSTLHPSDDVTKRHLNFSQEIMRNQSLSSLKMTHQLSIDSPLKYNQNDGHEITKRANVIGEIIENDDLSKFIASQVTFKEILALRFEYRMNLLQLVCHEEALKILKHLVTLVIDPEMKEQMVTYRDAHLGSQAIHLAAATGNYLVIDTLIADFHADVNTKNNNQQTVHHCASQMYDGIVAIFLFKRIHQIEVTAQDDKGATALHFAVISMQIKNV
jgi:hypothetical protein